MANHPNRGASTAPALTVNAVQMYLQPLAFEPGLHGKYWAITIRDASGYYRSDNNPSSSARDEEADRFHKKIVEVCRTNPEFPVRIGYKSGMQFRDGGTVALCEVVGAICSRSICREAGVLKLALKDGRVVHFIDWNARRQRPILGAFQDVRAPLDMIQPRFGSAAPEWEDGSARSVPSVDQKYRALEALIGG